MSYHEEEGGAAAQVNRASGSSPYLQRCFITLFHLFSLLPVIGQLGSMWGVTASSSKMLPEAWRSLAITSLKGVWWWAWLKQKDNPTSGPGNLQCLCMASFTVKQDET